MAAFYSLRNKACCSLRKKGQCGCACSAYCGGARTLGSSPKGLVIWNASSPHYRGALEASKGERLWRVQV